ncbi:hypothetical protein E5352_10900 [Stenotrophomonas maltophilia]|uniref:Teneurin-like YD-shell domain-containing protein n=2 Tax=Stenotrophomonas maltophilia TaxID=40324 RepID=A0A4S2CXW4_STEMA|nr:hypothetical protein E5352_10900 [Stenotrophomonas maltophilia]
MTMNGIFRAVVQRAMLLLAFTASGPAAHAQETVEYIHTDALGSPVAVTDANGVVIERTVYEPYGAVVGGQPKDGPGYTGHVSDSATGLSYMQQRYMDPEIGGFLSVDPVTADADPSVQFNRFRYANSNPYRFKDPNGRQSISVVYANPSSPTLSELKTERIGREVVNLTARGVRAGGSPAEIANLKNWKVKIDTTVAAAPSTGAAGETTARLVDGKVDQVQTTLSNKIQALESPGELKMNGGLVAQGGDTAKAAFGVHEFAGHGNAENLRMDSAAGAENMASDRAVEILSKDEELLVKPRIER